MSATAIDKREFRQALGTFVTGVTIVTTRARNGRLVGLTANSFNSVSLNPPLVLWSLSLNSGSLDAFREAGWWAVHILSADQEELSGRFAGRSDDKFAGVPITEGPDQIPLLSNCAARFVCRATFEYEGGDHAIFVGEVVELTQSPSVPLLYHGGKYGKLMPPTAKPPPIEPGDDGNFGRHFIGHILGQAHQNVFADVRNEYRKRGLRAADYTVMVSLGLGDDCTRHDLIARAALGGVELPQEPIDRLMERGLIREQSANLRLTEEGRRLLTELIAVAQASQLRLESRLSADEMGLLLHLLGRVSAAPAAETA